MKLHIKYFASLREKANKSDEYIDGEFSSLLHVYEHIDQLHKFQNQVESLRPSLNGKYVDFNYSPKDGDTVVFIPPVAGG